MDEVNEEVRGMSIGIFPTSNGIALQVSDGIGEDKTVVLDPDDAGKIAVNLISNVVLFQLNQSMKMAAERAEMERLRNMIMSNEGSNLSDPFARK